MKSIIITLITFLVFATVNAQDNYISILDPSIGLSHSELKLFLKGILKGREPAKAPNSDKIIYTIDNVDIHADYYIDKDSCLQAGIRFKNEASYKKAEDQIVSNCPPIKGMDDMYYKISQNGRLLYYLINIKEKIIVVTERNYFMGQ